MFKVGDIVVAKDHPDKRFHEVVSVEHFEAREPREGLSWRDPGCAAHTIVCAVPISAWRVDGKSMTPDGWEPAELSANQMKHLSAVIAVRESGYRG